MEHASRKHSRKQLNIEEKDPENICEIYNFCSNVYITLTEDLFCEVIHVHDIMYTFTHPNIKTPPLFLPMKHHVDTKTVYK